MTTTTTSPKSTNGDGDTNSNDEDENDHDNVCTRGPFVRHLRSWAWRMRRATAPDALRLRMTLRCASSAFSRSSSISLI